jgi:hypothetical protein
MVYCTEKTKISKENLKHKEEGSSIKKKGERNGCYLKEKFLKVLKDLRLETDWYEFELQKELRRNRRKVVKKNWRNKKRGERERTQCSKMIKRMESKL